MSLADFSSSCLRPRPRLFRSQRGLDVQQPPRDASTTRDPFAHRVARHHVSEQNSSIGETLETVGVLTQIQQDGLRRIHDGMGGRGGHLKRSWRDGRWRKTDLLDAPDSGEHRDHNARDDAGTQVPEGADAHAQTHLRDQRPARDGTCAEVGRGPPRSSGAVEHTSRPQHRHRDVQRPREGARHPALGPRPPRRDQRRVARRGQRFERRHGRRDRGGLSPTCRCSASGIAASPPATTSPSRTPPAATCCCSTPTWRSRRAALADLVAAMDARPRVGVASVRQRATDGTLLASIRRFPTPARGFGEALGAGGVAWLARFQELDTDFAALRARSGPRTGSWAPS